MNVKEMHIGIDVHLQKVDSEAFDNLRKEEKDWYLNSTMTRFLKNRSSSLSNQKGLGFQESQKRYDDLEKLVTTAVISMYKSNIDEFMYGVLPQDYFSLINSSSKMTYNQCNDIGIIDGDIVKTVYAVFPIADYVPYGTFNVVAESGGVAGLVDDIYKSINTKYPNLSVADQKYILINQLIEQINKSSRWEARYENYGTLYFVDSIIIIDKDADSSTGINEFTEGLNIYHDPQAADNITKTTYAWRTITNTALKVGTSTTSTGIITSQNRLVNQENLYNMLHHPFGKTTQLSPVSILKNGKIEVAYADNFLPTEVLIDYIRRPRLIDIIAGQSCELSDSVHEEIVDLAVQRIKAEISENNYQAILNENQLTE